MVNACIQYDPKDFIEQMQKISKGDENITDKLEKFLDRVGGRVEEALQSNELINVFQDDFEMLGDEEGAADSKMNSISNAPRNFNDREYGDKKRVSCIKFHPTKQYIVAMSLIANLSFDERAAISGKSFDSHVLLVNFQDSSNIALNYVLETPIEINTIEFHPEQPGVLIGGCISGQVIIWDMHNSSTMITGT